MVEFSLRKLSMNGFQSHDSNARNGDTSQMLVRALFNQDKSGFQSRNCPLLKLTLKLGCILKIELLMKRFSTNQFLLVWCLQVVVRV